MKKLIASLILFTVLISGCTQSQTVQKEDAKEACIQACENALEEGRDLSNGPCLIDPLKGGDWVCDVAHDPRQPVDDKKENQCDAWHNGTAENFVEVTPDCEFIRAG